MKLADLNALPDHVARDELLKVCGSREWARMMEEMRPFDDLVEAQAAAQECWKDLSRDSRLEAFAAHPRIGEKASSKWSQQEQSGVAGEDATKLLVKGTRYEERFKHVFLICATGKSSSEILAALDTRIGNSPEQEFEIACGEQSKIIRLRMEKFLTS